MKRCGSTTVRSCRRPSSTTCTRTWSVCQRWYIVHSLEPDRNLIPSATACNSKPRCCRCRYRFVEVHFAMNVNVPCITAASRSLVQLCPATQSNDSDRPCITEPCRAARAAVADDRASGAAAAQRRRGGGRGAADVGHAADAVPQPPQPPPRGAQLPRQLLLQLNSFCVLLGGCEAYGRFGTGGVAQVNSSLEMQCLGDCSV